MLRNLRRWAMLAPILAVLAAGPGCVTQPAVSVHHAELRGLSAFGLSTVIMLQVRNDNAYDVQIRNVNVNVTFGHGYPLGPINFQPNQWLQANRSTLVAVPVSIPWTILPGLVAETVGSYNIPYHVRGYADVTATRTFAIDRDNYKVDE